MTRFDFGVSGAALRTESPTFRRPLFLTPVIVAFLQAAVLNAQTTNPLDLLKEAAAPGERISYGSGALQFAEAAKKAGDSVSVTMMQNSGHFDGLNPKAPAWKTVLASIRSIIGTK